MIAPKPLQSTPADYLCNRRLKRSSVYIVILEGKVVLIWLSAGTDSRAHPRLDTKLQSPYRYLHAQLGLCPGPVHGVSSVNALKSNPSFLIPQMVCAQGPFQQSGTCTKASSLVNVAQTPSQIGLVLLPPSQAHIRTFPAHSHWKQQSCKRDVLGPAS